MNVYTQHFRSMCPKGGNWVDYLLTIETTDVIMVEAIQDAVKKFDGLFHEQIADDLWQQFGGRHRIVAHHHGTDVETVRP
jgi:hypothetical protein